MNGKRHLLAELEVLLDLGVHRGVVAHPPALPRKKERHKYVSYFNNPSHSSLEQELHTLPDVQEWSALKVDSEMVWME